MGLGSLIRCIAFVLLLFSFAILSTTPLVASASNGYVIYKNGDEPHGIPYRQWSANWWNYWMGIPNDNHPTLSYSQDSCRMNQKSPVWFLPDIVLAPSETVASIDISCEIPRGLDVLLPISTTACWYGDPEHNFPD